MDQNNNNNNSMILTNRKLPPGFRFQPTDEELVFEYLKRKILSWPLPASNIIPEINLCNYDPWDLPAHQMEIKDMNYFFSSNEAKYTNGKRINRATPSGFWKSTGIDRQIASSQIVGMKKTLVFYTGKQPYSSRSNWIMHEYRIVSFPNSTDLQISRNQAEKWVVCRIFMKNKSTTKIDVEPKFFDFMKRPEKINYNYNYNYDNDNDNESVCSSSNSSGITEVLNSTREDDDEQISHNFF